MSIQKLFRGLLWSAYLFVSISGAYAQETSDDNFEEGEGSAAPLAAVSDTSQASPVVAPSALAVTGPLPAASPVAPAQSVSPAGAVQPLVSNPLSEAGTAPISSSIETLVDSSLGETPQIDSAAPVAVQSAPVVTPVEPVSALNTGPAGVDRSHTVRSGIDTLGDDKEALSKEDEEVLDTVNVKSTSGNWVYKNYWWRKIEDVYGQIKEGFNKVMTTRMTFFVKRNEVDKELDRFYQQVGLEQGQLEDIINVGLELMDKEKKEQGFLNKKERDFLDKVKDRKRQLEQLKVDSKAIEELDTKINEAIDVVLKQIDVCSKYEQQAWEIFKSVARELSDKEAQKQYYETKTLLGDVEKVNVYLTGEFNSYFEKMIESVKEHTQSIMTQLSALEKEGISLKKELEIFEKEDETQEKRDLEKKRIEQEKADKKKKAEQKGFFSSVTSTVSSWFSSFNGWIGSVVTSVKGWFGSKIVSTKSVEVVAPLLQPEHKDGSQAGTVVMTTTTEHVAENTAETAS